MAARPPLPIHTVLLPDTLLKVGELAQAWGQFEFLIELLCSHHAGKAYDGGREPARRDISAKLKSLQAVADNTIKKGPAQNALREIVDRGIPAAFLRNLVFHGKWLADENGGNPRFMSWWKQPAGQPPNEMPQADMGRLVAEARELAWLAFNHCQGEGLLPP